MKYQDIYIKLLKQDINISSIYNNIEYEGIISYGKDYSNIKEYLKLLFNTYYDNEIISIQKEPMKTWEYGCIYESSFTKTFSNCKDLVIPLFSFRTRNKINYIFCCIEPTEPVDYDGESYGHMYKTFNINYFDIGGQIYPIKYKKTDDVINFDISELRSLIRPSGNKTLYKQEINIDNIYNTMNYQKIINYVNTENIIEYLTIYHTNIIDIDKDQVQYLTTLKSGYSYRYKDEYIIPIAIITSKYINYKYNSKYMLYLLYNPTIQSYQFQSSNIYYFMANKGEKLLKDKSPQRIILRNFNQQEIKERIIIK